MRGFTMKQVRYHHANNLVAEILEELRDFQMQMLALAKNINTLQEGDEMKYKE